MPDGADNLNRMKPQALPASERGKRARRRRSIGAMALEPRLMYDAAAVTTTANIWFTTNHTVGFNPNPAANSVDHIGVDGTSLATAPVDVSDGVTSGGELNQVSGVAVDTAHQKFFVVNKDTSGNWVILSGSTVTGALDATPVYTLAGAGRSAYISGLQVNAQTGELYFAQAVPNSTGQTGIFMVSESATNLTQANIAPTTTPADTTNVTQVVSLSSTETPKNFALDFKDNLVFFTDSAGTGQGGSNDKIGIASLSPGGPVSFFQASSLPGVTVNVNNGQLLGIAVDPNRDMLYFTSADGSKQDQNYVFSAHFTVSGSGNTATATLDTSTINHLTIGKNGEPTAIALDVPDGLFYVTNLTANPDVSTPPRPSGNIEVGSLDQAGNVNSSQSLTMVFDASTLTDSSGNLVGLNNPINLFIETGPMVTAGGSATFTQNGPAVTVEAGLTATDSAAQDFTSANVSISSGFLAGDTLAVDTSGTNITWSYDSAHGVLTLSGIDTAANYQRVLETVTFGSSSADPTSGHTDTQRTLTWTVSDGVLTSGATSTVIVHEAPIVAAGGTATFFGGGAPVALDGTLTVSDPDGTGTLNGATVTISSGFVQGDTLTAATTGTNITASYDPNTHALTLSGQDTLANYQTVLDSITYSFSPANGDPTAGNTEPARTITWVVDRVVDNSTVKSNAVNSALDTVHVAPSVGGVSSTATFIAGGQAVTVESGLTVADVDSNNTLVGATVSISGGFLAGDTLAADTTGTSITASYANGVLTLSGNDTPANYQRVLDSVAFSSSSTDPTNGGVDIKRSLTWTVSDGVASTSAASTVAVHTPPNITAGGTVTFTGGGPAVTLDGGVTVADVDSNGTLSMATVTISSGFASGDTLAAVTAGTNISASYANGVLTLNGQDTLANYQAVLDSVTYSVNPANGDPTAGGGDMTRTITWSVYDGVANSNTVTSTLDTVHVAPTVGGVSSAATFIAGGQAVTVESGLTVADVDSNNTLVGATVSISGGFLAGDTLAADTIGTSITASYANGVLTLSGSDTPANYQRVLDTVIFSSSSTDPTNGGVDIQRSLTWTVNDGVASTSAASTVAVHTPPNIAAGDPATFIAGSPAVTVDGGVIVGDVDSTTLTRATVTITGGFLAGDTLAANTSSTGIAASYDPTTGTLTLTGNDTPANYQRVLDSVTFNSTLADPTSGGTNIQRTLTWSVSDTLSSAAATSTVTVHTPPTVDAGNATATFTGGSSNPVTLDSTLTVSDVDSATLSKVTVTISSGFVKGDTLNFTGVSGITGSYDGAGQLTLSGPASVQDYQKVLDSITYSFNPTNGDPTGGGGHTSRTITWVVDDGVATSNAVTSTLDTVHVAPTLGGGGATATFTGGGPAVTLDGNLTVSDVDSNGTLSTATVTISSGFLQGDTLSANTSGTNITASYDSNSHTLTLSGTASVQDYQKVLDSVTYNFPGNGDPTQGGNTSRTISWAVNDGVAWSNSATSTVSTVNAVHTAPSLSGAGDTVLYAKHDAGVTIDRALTVTDPDSGGNLTGATVTISSGFASGDTLAAVTSGTNITASYNANTGVLTLTGQDTLANYQAVLDSVTYSSTSSNPALGNKDTTRTISWVVNDGATNNNLSTPVTSTIDIVPELQSVTHAPHGPQAAPVQTAALSMPSLSYDTALVTNVASDDADQHEDAKVVPWPGSERRSEPEVHAAVDLRHAVTATDADLLAAQRHHATNDHPRGHGGNEPAAGKPGLLKQLKAAGREGFVTERQALLKTLQQQHAGR